MINNKINKLFKNNFNFVLLILIVFFSILATNFYTLNKAKQKESFSNFFENTYLKKTIKIKSTKLKLFLNSLLILLFIIG